MILDLLKIETLRSAKNFQLRVTISYYPRGFIKSLLLVAHLWAYVIPSFGAQLSPGILRLLLVQD